MRIAVAVDSDKETIIKTYRNNKKFNVRDLNLYGNGNASKNIINSIQSFN